MTLIIKQTRKLKGITLRRVLSDYIQTRNLKPVTVKNYTQRLTYLSDWVDLPIIEITRDMIEERHRQIASHSMANSVFRTLRALLEYAIAKYENTDGSPLLLNNPVKRLNELRVWHKDKKRKTIIQSRDLKDWFRAVFGLSNPTMRDYFMTLILAGMRSGEARDLLWSDVDLDGGTILLRDTKNGEDRLVPMSDFLWRILAHRRFGARSQFVFPSDNRLQPISGSYKSYKAVIIRSGVKFCPHDLRRTFASVGDELEIKSEVIATLLGHKSKDITEGYTIRSIERLRRASQRITDQILTYGGLMAPVERSGYAENHKNHIEASIRRLSDRQATKAKNA